MGGQFDLPLLWLCFCSRLGQSPHSSKNNLDRTPGATGLSRVRAQPMSPVCAAYPLVLAQGRLCRCATTAGQRNN